MHISPFMLFWLLLAVYFIFILDYRSDVRQKANLSNFFIWVQNGSKTVKTTRNISNAFDPGTAKDCSGGARSFAQEIEPWRWGAQWPAIRNWQQSIETSHQSWSFYNYRRSCQRTQRLLFYGHLAFKANWEGEKAW